MLWRSIIPWQRSCRLMQRRSRTAFCVSSGSCSCALSRQYQLKERSSHLNISLQMFNKNKPSILLAAHKQGISGRNSRSSEYHLGKFLYVTFRVTSKTWKTKSSQQTCVHQFVDNAAFKCVPIYKRGLGGSMKGAYYWNVLDLQYPRNLQTKTVRSPAKFILYIHSTLHDLPTWTFMSLSSVKYLNSVSAYVDSCWGLLLWVKERSIMKYHH